MLLLQTLVIVILFIRFDGLLSIALSHAVTTNTMTRTTFNVQYIFNENIQYPCGTQRVEVKQPTWLLVRLNRYLQDIQDGADNITKSLKQGLFANLHIDTWAPPVHYLNGHMPSVPKIDAASDATSKNMSVARLLEQFYRDMSSYWMAVHQSLATEQRLEDGGFGKSLTKHGLYKSEQNIQNALCSITEMQTHIKQTVPSAVIDSVLQLHWYQFPVNNVVNRYQNHLRQYSLGRDLKGTVLALRHQLHINEQRLFQSLKTHGTH